MANPENLIPHQFTSDQSREEAAKNGRKGGIASGDARRRRKSYDDIARRVLTAELDPASRAKVEKVTGELEDDESTLYAAALAQMVARAVQGDPRAFREIQNVIDRSRPAHEMDGREDDALSAALKELGGSL